MSTTQQRAHASSVSRWATLHTCETYPSPSAGHEAFEKLLAAGTPPEHVHLLIGRQVRDIRREPVGTFAGEIGPTTLIGTFGGQPRQRREARGSFVNKPDQPKGSFAETDDDLVVTLDHGHEISRILDRRTVRQLLRPVALDRAHVDQLLAELHDGHALLIVAQAQTHDEPAEHTS
jgi:hypothetical protein